MRVITKSAVAVTTVLAFSASLLATAGQHSEAKVYSVASATSSAGAAPIDLRTFSSTGQAPSYTFVAAPDFLNQDVGDVSGLPRWNPGEPNSWTPQLQQSIEVFLNEIQAQHPGSVLVPGDLVEGHWLKDVAHTGVFGPMRTTSQRVATLRRAANFYHSLYLKRFTERGLTLRAAIGDHDIGDNPWAGRSRLQVFKRQHVQVYKDVFGKYYTHRPNGRYRYANRPKGTPWENTAYSVQLSPDLLLVSVDVFDVTRRNVVSQVVGGQLEWLRRVLKRAQARGTRWIVVQGHDPVATPVRTRSSSGMSVRKGTRSALWRTMARYGVDVYLAGEVHDTTMRKADGITQIATGGLLYKGEATYMTAKVFGDHIDFDVREFDREGRRDGKLWQFGAWRTTGGTQLLPGSHSVGTLTLHANGRTTNASGKLVRYTR